MQSAIDLHLLPLLGSYPLNAIDEDVAQATIAALSRKGLSAKSVKVYFGYLKAILGKKFCRDWEVKQPQQSQQERFSFTSEQSAQIIANSKGHKRTIAMILAETGARINEVLGFHVEDIDFDAKTIKACRSVHKGQAGPTKTKKGHRSIHVSSMAIGDLAAHIGHRDSGIVFSTRKNTYMNGGNLRNRWFNPLFARHYQSHSRRDRRSTRYGTAESQCCAMRGFRRT